MITLSECIAETVGYYEEGLMSQWSIIGLESGPILFMLHFVVGLNWKPASSACLSVRGYNLPLQVSCRVSRGSGLGWAFFQAVSLASRPLSLPLVTLPSVYFRYLCLCDCQLSSPFPKLLTGMRYRVELQVATCISRKFGSGTSTTQIAEVAAN